MILLDKDYALEKAENQYYLGYIDEYKKNAIIKFLNSLPSAHPEIIRCKECKEFRRYIDTDITFCDRTECERKPDDFCSMAERRTDG